MIYRTDTVTSHVRKIDIQLDGLQLAKTRSEYFDERTSTPDSKISLDDAAPGSRFRQLQSAVKAFTTASTSQTLLDPIPILALLRQGRLLGYTPTSEDREESDLDWLLVSKATNQTYGLVLRLLLDETIPLSNEIDYWNEVLGSYQYTVLYSIQTSPARLFAWAKDIYGDASNRVQQTADEDESGGAASYADSVLNRWKRFYQLVQDSVRERSLADMQSKFMSPITISQSEVRSKRRRLERLRETNGSGIGILVDEGMVLDADDETSISSKSRSDDRDEWKSVVSKSVSLMEAVLTNTTRSELALADFEDLVFTNVDEESSVPHDPDNEGMAYTHTSQIALRLEKVLNIHIPQYAHNLKQARSVYGRPSRLVRYWLPGTLLLFSSGTLFRFLFRRKAAILAWIEDSGKTALDFWYNWVVEPIKKIIGTIRHDKDSEIAIMSKESLKGDQASLERMVVDFAIDDSNGGKAMSEAQVADLRAKVKEGDLTPVLKAYERDLRRPFVGTLRGDLVRALLIQIQKTKVDVEVAIGGIDNLLKSQELVFGFVGLTPSLLVCIGAYRWLGDFITGRRGRDAGRQHESLLWLLSNIDRILTAATPANNGMLSYKEHGMLLCEAHALQQRAMKILPKKIYDRFSRELREVMDLRTGIERQLHVVERIRWDYFSYLR